MTRNGKPLGYLTPDAAPDDLLCRSFSIPNDDRWLGNFMGALYALTQEENWKQYGDLTPEQAAEAYRDIFDAGYFGVANCEIAPTPYWEEQTGDDSDDEGGALSEIWYGLWDGANIVDTLAGFVFTGFVAATFGVEGAIQFATLLIRLRLFFRTADVGAIVGVFVNGDHLFDVDTYSPIAGKKAVDLFLNAPAGFMIEDVLPNTFTLVNSGTANPLATPNTDGNFLMSIIRKQISEDEIAPTNIIYDPDCDCIKKDWGDGSGFVDYPQGDPRHSIALLRPALTTDDPRCDSAANMVDWLHRFIDSAIDTMAAFGFLGSVVNLLAGYLLELAPEFAWLIALIGEAAAEILGVGSVALNAAFDTGTYDTIQCIFFCRIETDGSVTPDDLERIEADMTAQINTTAALVVNAILAIQGEVGLANAGRIGTMTGDCTSCLCGWCAAWDWTALEDLAGFSLDRGSYDAAYVGAFVDTNSKSSVILSMTLDTPMRVTSIATVYSGSFAGANGAVRINGYLGGSHVINHTTTAGGSHVGFTWTGDETIDYLQIDTNSGTDATESKIETCQIEGLDTRPDIGQVDCS